MSANDRGGAAAAEPARHAGVDPHDPLELIEPPPPVAPPPGKRSLTAMLPPREVRPGVREHVEIHRPSVTAAAPAAPPRAAKPPAAAAEADDDPFALHITLAERRPREHRKPAGHDQTAPTDARPAPKPGATAPLPPPEA